MKTIPKPKGRTATLYYFRLIDLEKKLGQKERERKKIEKENNDLKNKLKEAEKRIKELQHENGNLRDENANLKECRKTYAKMLFKGRTEKTEEVKRGRGEGHPGVSRVRPEEERILNEVDVTLSACPGCGEIFTGCKRRYERIIEDITFEPKANITRYRIHQYECPGCGAAVSAKSKNIIGQSPFGRKLFAAVLFYRYRMKSPLAKIKESLKEIHGFEISGGGIQNLLYQASVQFGEKYEELKRLLKDGKIAHADETGWRVNGENWWTWLWANDEITLFTTENTRGQGIPEKMLKTFKGLLTRDGYSGYNIVDTDQQVCWVHLLRRAHEYCGRDRATEEMILLKDTLKKIYKRLCGWHKEEHAEAERLDYHDRRKQMMTDLWKKRTWKEKDAKTFIKMWLIRHQNRLVTFLKYPESSPENNPAERAVRPMVILRKITGGSKSQRGIRATDINMSVIETWVKQGLSIMQEIPIFGLSL